VVTLINVFTVGPANQQRLVDILTRPTDGLADSAPGFISSTPYRSMDGTKVTMYQVMRQDPGPQPAKSPRPADCPRW
jgi:hypothetical protein